MRLLNPFKKPTYSHGSDMGRVSNLPSRFENLSASDMRVVHQGGTGGYDKGGVYWGLPSNVWAVIAFETSVIYVRAESALDAIRLIQGK